MTTLLPSIQPHELTGLQQSVDIALPGALVCRLEVRARQHRLLRRWAAAIKQPVDAIYPAREVVLGSDVGTAQHLAGAAHDEGVIHEKQRLRRDRRVLA